MKLLTTLLLLIAGYCHAQPDYNTRLRQVTAEIKTLKYFDNGVVVYDENTTPAIVFPIWTPEATFYEDDMVLLKRNTYRALTESTGKNPTTSPREWVLEAGPHPYLFLKDSAQAQDLVQLLTSDHAYLRVYAFAALVRKNYDKQFQTIINNLPDTTTISQSTSDVGFDVHPADLMIWYSSMNLTTAQKDQLKKLILSRYTHLYNLKEILLFHKPSPEDYSHVKKIAQTSPLRVYGAIALSRYRKPGDVELIRQAMKEETFYAGYKVIFMAVESFPDPGFKKELIEQKKEINMEGNLFGDKYYLNALAAYKDKECLAVLEEFVNQPAPDNSPMSATRSRNLRLIHDSLMKYRTELYEPLIRRVELLISKGGKEGYYDYQIEKNFWNY